MTRTHERVRLHRGGLTGEWAAVRVSPSGVITDRWPIHPDDQAVLNDRWQTAAAARPSVTDNARADSAWIEWAQNLTGAYVTTTEEARQQIEGLVSGLMELTGLAPGAAGRAETTADE